MSVKPDDRRHGGDGSGHDDPALKQWDLKCDDYGAARRALYAARAQLE
jgi:hypothetical protein